jgi:hypothetical protein
MYSQKRISQNAVPNFIYIFPDSFMIFWQELKDAAVLLLITNMMLVPMPTTA